MSQYKRNINLKNLKLFKQTKSKTQQDMVNEMIQIDRKSCLYCTLIFFSFLYTILILASFEDSEPRMLEVKATDLEAKLKKLKEKISVLNNKTENFKSEIIPSNFQREFEMKCTKPALPASKESLKIDVNTLFKNELASIEAVHFVSFGKLNVKLVPQNVGAGKLLGYDLKVSGANGKAFEVEMSYTGLKMDKQQSICLLVSGVKKTSRI